VSSVADAVGSKLVVSVALTLLWTGITALLRHPGPNVSRRAKRVALALGAAISAGLLAWLYWTPPQAQPSDVAPVWASARALIHRQDPYAAVGPGRAYDTPFPQIYPMTSIVAFVPLAPLPLRWADPLFCALGFGLYTWAVTARRLATPALVALVSLPALMTLQTSQWSFLLTGAALVPALGFLLAAKPTVGLALFVGNPRWKTAVGCALLVAVSFLAWPGWVAAWRATLASAPHVVPPITRPGGFLLLLALLKWRRADARLLLALACLPQTTSLYETIPLFLIPQTWLEGASLWALAVLAHVGQRWVSAPYDTTFAYWTSGARWIVALMYLPCLVMVLRRPNAREPLASIGGVSTR